MHYLQEFMRKYKDVRISQTVEEGRNKIIFHLTSELMTYRHKCRGTNKRKLINKDVISVISFFYFLEEVLVQQLPIIAQYFFMNSAYDDGLLIAFVWCVV